MIPENKTFFDAFCRGCTFVTRGIWEFFCRPRLWIYALIPLVIVCAIGMGMSSYIMSEYVTPLSTRVQHAIEGWGWEGLANAVEAIIRWTCFIALLLVRAVIIGALYEAVGSVFFARMVRHYEHIAYHRPRVSDIPLSEDLANALSCVCHSIGTLLLYIPMFFLGFFIPVIAHILTILFIGYRYGIGYCSEAGFNRHLSIGQLKMQFSGARQGMLFGFGTVVFLFLMIPVLSLVFIPGFVIGGTILVNEECFPEARDR